MHRKNLYAIIFQQCVTEVTQYFCFSSNCNLFLKWLVHTLKNQYSANSASKNQYSCFSTLKLIWVKKFLLSSEIKDLLGNLRKLEAHVNVLKNANEKLVQRIMKKRNGVEQMPSICAVNVWSWYAYPP